MRRVLAFLAPFAGILATQACTTSIQVGADGAGGGQTTGPSSSSTSSSGTSSSSSSSSGTTTSVDVGTPDPTCWDNNPVSGLGGPCGGFMANPPSCISGLTCHEDAPDAVGTCAPASAQVSPAGGMCGGFAGTLCAWNTDCVIPQGSDAGTCVYRNCASPPGNGCTNPQVTVAGDGPTKTFDFVCQGEGQGSTPTSATGYIGYPSPQFMGPEQIWIKGCASANGAPLQGSLSITGPQAMVGSTMTASVEYDSGVDTFSNGGTATLNVTELSADTISGTYTASVQPTNGNGVSTVWGRFRVCRTPDFLPP